MVSMWVRAQVLLLCRLCLAATWESACETSSCSGDNCCPSNYYWIGERDCDDWFTGLFADNRIQTCQECNYCGSGQYLYACGIGSAGTCYNCGRGYAKSGTDQATQCQACDAGQYSGGGWTNCQNCNPGTFQPFLAMDTCYTCEDGQSSNSGSTSCFNCGTGSFALAGDSSCTTCPVGRFASNEKSSACERCAPGLYADQEGMSECKTCFRGTYSTGGASFCRPCDRGYFSTQSQRSDCDACPEGYFAFGLGSTECTACLAGTFSGGPGSSACSACSQGYYIPSSAQTTCLPCEPGTHGPIEAASSCIDCAPGTFARAAADSCTECPMGSFTELARQSECILCPAGSYGNESLGASSNETCSECPAGRASALPGAAGFDSCAICPAGRYAEMDASTECMECPPGRYGTLEGATSLNDCIKCPMGTFSNRSAADSLDSCEDCPPGTWSNILGETLCVDCEAGTYSNTSGATTNSTCEACDVGRYSPLPGAPSESSCFECPAGRWNNELAQAECEPCSPGTWSSAVGAVWRSTCQNCAAGSYSDLPGGSELASCLGCPPGKWVDLAGATRCKDCQEGTWSSVSGASEDVCQNCTAGRFGTMQGQSDVDDCQPCAMGTWSFEGLTACTSCIAGTWSDTPAADSPSTCTGCDLGRFSTSLGATSSNTCEACTVKTFANQSGSSECFNCGAGQASQEGSSECSDCGAGFYSGPASCEQCPVARYSDSPQASCSQCQAGYVVNTQRTACVPCAVGRYSDAAGAADCKDCGLGFYGLKEGGVSVADACQGCPVGRVSDVTFLASVDGCRSCEPGSFMGSTGAASCDPCPAGEYQETSGQAACVPCNTGRFLQDSGSSLAGACEACPAGRTSPAGASECSDCPAGRHAMNAGQGSCADCPAANETGSIGCCPGDSDEWPLEDGFMLSLPPGKSATVIHVLENCQVDVNPEAPGLEDLALRPGRRFSGNPLSLATIRPAGIHSCVDLACGANNTCAYVEPESADFSPGGRLEVYAVVSRRLPQGGLSTYTCPQMVSVSFAGFGCQEGALLSFGLAHLCVVFITLFLAILVELFLRRHIDVFLEVALDVSGNELQPIPSTMELHKDVVQTLQLKSNEMPPSRFQAWQTSQEDKVTKVQMEFQVSAIAGADMEVRDSWFAKANAHSLCGNQEDQYVHAEELYKQVESLEWKVEGAWSKSENLAVKRQPLAVVKEVGRLPGADLVDSLEAIAARVFGCCCGCISRRLPRLNEETEALRLRAARAMLQALMTRKMGYVLVLRALYTLGCVFVLPLVALQMMTCAGGYPYEVHFAWLATWLLGNFSCNFLAFCQARHFDRAAVQEFSLRFHMPLLLRFFFAFVSVTDLYQDATFPVISYRCGFDLWFVATWLVVLGVVVMQILLQVVLVLQCYRKSQAARTPEERERYHVEGLFLALRALDNHVLVYSVRPAVEERLGGSSCWKMKTVESRIAFSRFIFEDAEQCALQGIFLVWFESASLSDKIWIGLSTATSLSLSFTLAVQTFAEVRDWVWHRMLAVLTMNGTWISRWVMLMVMVVLYRCVSAFPWFGSCAPAEDEYASSGLTFILRFLAPWQFHVPPHVVQEIFSTSIAAIILAAIVTLLILLIYRRELGIVSVRRKHRGKYNFEERLKPPEQRLKSEHDEDDWLDALRELYGSHGAVDTKLASLDEKLYHLARGQSGSSKAHFHSTEAKIREELLQVGTQLPDPDTPSFKELERVTDSALKRWGCRTKALALLADRSFRKKSLLVKAQMIEEATGARLRVLPAKALSSLRELPRCSDEPSSVTYEVDELQRNTQGRHLILVYVSHTGEDNRSPGKVQGLLEFSKWFEARAREQEMDFELFFWIDYCCLSPTEAFAALPLFIATCTEILVWRTPLFDRRVWPLTERLLAYCFCKGGLTPYALDAASFVNTDETEAADAGEDEEKIEAIWAGSTGKAGPSPRKVAPAPQLQMLRRQRRLIDPLQETLLDTAGLQRRVAQLVDMASSVSALEIFADRQPVDFGLTAVVELWLGSNQTLPSKASKAPRVAWSGDATQWICASRLSDEDRALKASYEWRLKVEVKSSAAAAPGRAEPSTVEANNNPNADMDFYSDEWISVILPSDVDASSPSPNEIAEHFQQVDQILRSKKIGREVDLSQLETAAARLGSVLCADLARALEADTVEAIEGALKRNHRADLPKLHAALRRLCELQLLRALSGDESELTMALREAARVGGEEASYFEHFTEAKQKLSNLRAKRLQQQSLDVIRGDGKDLESVMAVISVALRRSDWDREWDQIWLEVLQEGRAQVKKMVDDAKSKGDHPKVAKIYRLAEKHGLRVIAAHTVAVWEDLIQSSRQDAKTLAKLCSAAYDEGAACKQFLADAEEAVLALAKELEEQWDKSKAQSCSESFAELVQELSADANLSRLFEEVQSAGYRASERERGLREKAEAVLQQKAGLMSHEDSELSMEHLQEVLEALKDSQDWQWQKNIHHATELLQKQVKACFKNRGMMDAQPMLLDLMEAAKTHQVTDQLTPLLEKALRGHLEKGGSRTKPQKETDAVKLLQISLCAEKLQLSDVRVKAIEEMKRSVEAMKNKGADGLTELRTFQDEAQRLDALAAVELATESLAQVEERERKKKEDFQAKLVAEEGKDIFGADPELTVQLVATAEQSGWQEQKNRAVELVQRRLLESARALKASSDEAISGVRFLARAFSEAEKAKCSVEASLKDALNQLEGSGDELVPLVRVIAWCQDLKWLLKSAQKKLNEWLKKWDAGPEHAPKDAEKAAEEAQKLDAKEIGEKIQAKLNADAIFKAATDAPADAEKALKAYEQSAKRSENLRKQALKMLTRTLEEAKQSGDEKQLTLLRDQKHQKTVSDQAGHLLSLMSQLPTRLAAGDWPGVCGLAASAQKEGYSALAKQARQHLRDRVDELTTKTESAEGPMLDLYKAAKKDGLDELAELLVQKLGSALPASWAAVKGTSLSVRKELISDEEVIKRMQEMVDHTFKTWGGTAKTRDRRKKLVTSIKVEEVIHVENPDNYLRYAMRREKVRQELQSKPMTGTELDDANPIKTKQVSLKGLSFHPDEPIDEKLQEVWLWHGTGKEGAAGITDTDFDMGRAGSAAGTMFGRGLYFAESCMKSDEYTKADERDWYPLILCRVTCGRLFYCDWKSPSDHKEKLEDACHHEGFHCVLGDREKVRGTYREFIVFDNDQVYPEYIVWYSR